MSLFPDSEAGAATAGGRVRLVPAFTNARHALLFAVFTVCLLVLPSLLALLPLERQADVYKSIPLNFANYYTVGALLDAPEEIDILFLGGSETQTAVDVRMITAQLSAKLGRPVYAANLSTSWPGYDRSAQFLVDVLEKKHPALVVVGETPLTRDRPHAVAKFFWNGRALPDDAGWSERMLFYYARFLGAPRQMWRRFADGGRETLEPMAGTTRGKLIESRGFRYYEVGWRLDEPPPGKKRRKTIRPLPDDVSVPRDLAADEMILTRESRPAAFITTGEAYSCQQTRYLQYMRQISLEHGAKFASIVMPIGFEGRGVIAKVEVRPLCGEAERDWPVIGVAMADMFGARPLEDVKNYYVNYSHLNPSGAKMMTHLIMPAVEKLYDETPAH